MGKGIVAMAVAILAVAGVLFPVAAQEECQTETLDNIQTDVYLGVIGGLNFGGNFAGFINNGLWPACADRVAWMPAAVSPGPAQSTTNSLTRVITFEDGCCILTSIVVASHEETPGDLTIRALDASNVQVGNTIQRDDLVFSDGCVTIPTNFTECAAKFEITYSRGSELGIIAISYCCGEDVPGGEGCTPGYWKQPHHFDSWVGYTQNQDFDTVFGVNFFNPNRTLLVALQTGGGGLNRLGRHGTAALLNAEPNSGVDYPYTTAEVIALVQAGDADALEEANELGCPLN